jgi:quinol-cytochrome oxidoreductase complex cytochrome b subunit
MSKPYYAIGMTAIGLPARIAYAVAALLLVSAVGFYAALPIFTWLSPHLQDSHPIMEGYDVFTMALGTGLLLAFTASCIALTLPWKRRRKRRGRPVRFVISGVFLIFVCLCLGDEEYSYLFDLVIAVWLSVTLVFTFVRYGVLDQAKRDSSLQAAAAARKQRKIYG